MTKYLRISSYIMKPFLIYDFATAPLGISLYIGCLKSNDTLTIYLAEAMSFFLFVLSTFLFFHNEPGSIVYLF